jgi:hypothetical protein
VGFIACCQVDYLLSARDVAKGRGRTFSMVAAGNFEVERTRWAAERDTVPVEDGSI